MRSLNDDTNHVATMRSLRDYVATMRSVIQHVCSDDAPLMHALFSALSLQQVI